MGGKRGGEEGEMGEWVGREGWVSGWEGRDKSDVNYC